MSPTIYLPDGLRLFLALDHNVLHGIVHVDKNVLPLLKRVGGEEEWQPFFLDAFADVLLSLQQTGGWGAIVQQLAPPATRLHHLRGRVGAG